MYLKTNSLLGIIMIMSKHNFSQISYLLDFFIFLINEQKKILQFTAYDLVLS